MPIINVRNTAISNPAVGSNATSGRVAFKRPQIDPANHVKSTNDLAKATEEAINKLSARIDAKP